VGKKKEETVVFSKKDFTETPWNTPEDKAKFANLLITFVKEGCKSTNVTKKLYGQLSQCFGHIAHYNAEGFYEVWFSTAEKRVKWLEYVLTFKHYGDPACTYSDVEAAFIGWLRMQEDMLHGFRELARLERKDRAEKDQCPHCGGAL